MKALGNIERGMIKKNSSRVQEVGREEAMKRSEVWLHTLDCPFSVELYKSCFDDCNKIYDQM